MTQKQLALDVNKIGVAYRSRKGFFSHEKYWALKDVSFKLYHGETLGIVGRNGVGKSTLLRALAGIISPDSGEVINNNVSVSLLSLQVGFARHLTGRENAVLSGMLLGLSKKDINERMGEIRRYADIGNFFDMPVGSYSSGMRARLGFSVAIHADPDVILLDEVLGVGDIDFRKKSTESMKEIINSDKTIVLVSHSSSLVREVCNKAVWINQGVVRSDGDVNDVLDEYDEFHKRHRKNRE